MTESSGARGRLAELMDDRRAELRMKWGDVAGLAGISIALLRNIRNGTAPITKDSKVRIEIALQWPRGTIDGILKGDQASTPLVASPLSRRQLTDIDRKVVGIYLDLLRQGKSTSEAKDLASTVGKVLELDEEIDTLISVFEAEHSD